MKKIAILQSNYIPWKGYFDLIAAVDEFVLYDDVQFTKNDWRNRNKIKTPKGVEWISIPTGSDIDRRIRDVELPNHFWQGKHWKTLEANYRRARHFSAVAEVIAPYFLERRHSNLSALNRMLIEAVCKYLSIGTKISNSWDYEMLGDRSERLARVCVAAGATSYVSGPAAKNYLDEKCFSERGINVEWFDYSGYPVYPQLWGEFVHGVTILDLLFNCGQDSPLYMRYVRR